MTGWHPVATIDDVAPRHVFRGQLSGRELAIWRADDGYVNVWENRCLHRGVRLSIGCNDGAELVCRYHGWRYANRTAGCTYIPAHPADSPARTITSTTYPAVERYGLVWTTVDPDAADEPPTVGALGTDAFGLRNLPVAAPAELVAHHLTGPGATREGLCVVADAEIDGEVSTIVSFVQPVDAARCVIRPVLAGSPTDPLRVWRQHAQRLRELIADIEALPEAASGEPSTPLLETPVVLPTTDRAATADTILTTVARTWSTADGIVGIELTPAENDGLPTFQPGDHIDVHLPGDLIRQYSLTNAPGETDRYRIGVKLEPDSRGGSVAMHALTEGDRVRISPPRNSFPLRRNTPHSLLIAGGIGITPILSMAQALRSMDLAVDLRYFVSATAQIAFPEVLDTLGDSVHRHVGLSPTETVAALDELLSDARPGTQLYACGPPAMLDAVRDLATHHGWPDDTVRFEYFENTTELDLSGTFSVDLARSALSLEVAAGETVLDVLRKHGVSMVSSCEQGACGTCAATVLDGEPLHQDVYLNAAEREAGDTMLTCVSRARSERLVLDL